MTTELHWQMIALRLLLTVIAGGLLGFERSKSGHPAGIRTTLLVTLAASLAMIQMNLLIPTNGKPHDSYAVLDLMRLPLGILTGVGFIGAGAIVRKDEMVLGVTTAATMWFATVVGLCLGGGQIILGSTATVLGVLILWGIRFIERNLITSQRGVLTVSGDSSLNAPMLLSMLADAHFHVKSASVLYDGIDRSKFSFEVKWQARDSYEIPAVVQKLHQTVGVSSCEWSGSGHPAD